MMVVWEAIGVILFHPESRDMFSITQNVVPTPFKPYFSVIEIVNRNFTATKKKDFRHKNGRHYNIEGVGNVSNN
jgi:hypothetical protein